MQATTERVPCQVRSKTESPCLHRAVVEIRGIPFCEACAREQEAYFAIGELTWETPDTGIEPPGKVFGEALEGIRRRRADSLAAVGRLDFFLASTKASASRARKAKQSQPGKWQNRARSNRARRPNEVEHMSEDAQALIRAAREVHVERHGAQTFLAGTHLSFPEAARRAGIRSDRQRYHDAIDDLEYEGAIEWDESARYARGDKHYLITRRGLDDLGSAGTVAIREGQQRLFEG